MVVSFTMWRLNQIQFYNTKQLALEYCCAPCMDYRPCLVTHCVLFHAIYILGTREVMLEKSVLANTAGDLSRPKPKPGRQSPKSKALIISLADL